MSFSMKSAKGLANQPKLSLVARLGNSFGGFLLNKHGKPEWLFQQILAIGLNSEIDYLNIHRCFGHI